MDRQRIGKNRAAADRIATAQYGGAAQEIHPAAQSLFKILLQPSHLQQSCLGLRDKLHQQIHVAARLWRAPGNRAKNFHACNRTMLSGGMHRGAHGIQTRR